MKKQIPFLIIGLLLCFNFKQSLSQTDVLISFKEGTTKTFSVSENGKLYFNENDLLIEDGGNSPEVISLSDIRKINFSSPNEVSIPQVVENKEENLFIYPNPAKEFIKVGNLSGEKMSVLIYNLSGKLIMKKDYLFNDQIDISHLSPGYYIIRVNSKVFKFCKL